MEKISPLVSNNIVFREPSSCFSLICGLFDINKCLLSPVFSVVCWGMEIGNLSILKNAIFMILQSCFINYLVTLLSQK